MDDVFDDEDNTDEGNEEAETSEVFTFGVDLGNGVWLGGCPQVKRALPTRSGGCRSGSAARAGCPHPGGLASGSSGGRSRRWRG